MQSLDPATIRGRQVLTANGITPPDAKGRVKHGRVGKEGTRGPTSVPQKPLVTKQEVRNRKAQKDLKLQTDRVDTIEQHINNPRLPPDLVYKLQQERIARTEAIAVQRRTVCAV